MRSRREPMTATELDLRFLLMAPTAGDAETTCPLLNAAGIATASFSALDALAQALNQGAGAVMIGEEHLTPGSTAPLSAWLSRQPPWSDLPILILTRPGADSPESAEAWRTLGNVTLLERPTRVTTLLSAAQTAIRARARQYQIRGHLAERQKIEQALRTADRRKDEFLATLGHELRNPLAPILNSLEILKLSGAFEDARTAPACAVMERQVHHLNRLVDDLLEVSRITRGIIEVKKEPLDLTAIVKAAIETSRPVLDNLRHEIRADFEPNQICVGGDPVRLTQVFANLLNNAAKYTNHGGVIRVTDPRREWRGHGQRERQRHRHRAQPVVAGVRHVHAGRSLDAAIARRAGDRPDARAQPREHARRVGRSQERRSRSRQRIRRAPAAADCSGVDRRDRAAASSRCPRSAFSSWTTAATAARAWRCCCACSAPKCALAHSGRDALDCVTSFNPDVVLLDIGMPGMDGYEVARRIRANPNNRHISLIALTGWGQDEDRQRSAAAGFDHHLVKPADIDQLRQLLTVA